jgi:hypothetical protein
LAANADLLSVTRARTLAVAQGLLLELRHPDVVMLDPRMHDSARDVLLRAGFWRAYAPACLPAAVSRPLSIPIY